MPGTIRASGNPPGGITYEDEATLGADTVADYTDNQNPVLEKAVAHGTKVMHFHGTADPAIFWRTSADYYRRVATWYGGGTADFKKLQQWYRFFPMPNVGHGTGSAAIGSLGPSPQITHLSRRFGPVGLGDHGPKQPQAVANGALAPAATAAC